MTMLDYQWSSGWAFGAFEKLKGMENYFQWSKRMIDILAALNQLEVVDGSVTTTPAPADPAHPTAAETAALKLWNQHTHHTYIEISLCIEDIIEDE